MKRHQYQLTIATESGLTTDESVRCLRAMLKAMLRSYGVRCLSAIAVEPLDVPQNEPQSTNEAIDDE